MSNERISQTGNINKTFISYRILLPAAYVNSKICVTEKVTRGAPEILRNKLRIKFVYATLLPTVFIFQVAALL